jgi:hypothetical protein
LSISFDVPQIWRVRREAGDSMSIVFATGRGSLGSSAHLADFLEIRRSCGGAGDAAADAGNVLLIFLSRL